MLRDLMPTDKVCGYEVRPGYYQVDGATPVRGGVNFTISSVYATSCELLLLSRRLLSRMQGSDFPTATK